MAFKYFGRPPNTTCLDDAISKRDVTWSGAPFPYLFTTMFDEVSPLRRGDNGEPIPIYRLSGEHQDRESIFFWQSAYKHHDAIWLLSGALEIPAYRQLASDESALSQHGREICKWVETATGVPTYYYLLRYWGRQGSAEQNRRCPGCGRDWRTKESR